MEKYVCKNCGNNTFEVVFHTSNIGIYCSNCGKYYKFLNKFELKAMGFSRKRMSKSYKKKFYVDQYLKKIEKEKK